jgi:hypothetical protein
MALSASPGLETWDRLKAAGLDSARDFVLDVPVR